MTDIEDIDRRLAALETLMSAPSSNPMAAALPDLRRVFGGAWFTTGAILRSTDPELVRLFAGMSAQMIGRRLRECAGLHLGAARFDLGNHFGQHRFRFSPAPQTGELILTVTGPVCGGRTHLLRRVADLLKDEYGFDVDVAHNRLVVREVRTASGWMTYDAFLALDHTGRG